METRIFGNTGVKVPVIGQGTWRMEHDDEEAAIEALLRGLDAGMTHIDTAELYGAGRVEERIVSKVIKGRRKEVFLVSKVLPRNASRQGTIKACEGSLRRLGTDYLDCYLLHWPGNHPLEDTLSAFEQLVEDGKIRSYGVSNFAREDLEEALSIVGEGKIACNQVLYHLEERAIEHEVLPWCARHQVALVAYSPFGAGRFPSPRSRGGKVLAEVARRHGATPYQVALRFLLRSPATFVIPKASQAEHAIENAKADALTLTEEDIREIDAAFPLGAPRRGVPVI